MKKYVIGFILGLIVMGGVGVAAYSYTAKQVSFTPNDKSWKVSTVEDALNSIKTTMPDLSKVTISSASDIIKGKKTYDSNGNLITGTYTDNCVKGNFTYKSSGDKEIVNFVPSEIMMIDNSANWVIYYTDAEEWEGKYWELDVEKNWKDVSEFFQIKNNSLYTKNWEGDENAYYIACK